MRVTNAMLVNNFMHNLTNNLNKQDYLLNQMATNKKVAHYSDDPAAYIYSQAARKKLNRLSEYQLNVRDAQDWLTQVETASMDINKTLVNAYEACLSAATDVKSGNDRELDSKYMEQMRDQLLQTLNTAFGDRFVFGGYNTAGYTDDGNVIPPFTVGDDPGDPGNPNTIPPTPSRPSNVGHLLYNGFDLNTAVTKKPDETDATKYPLGVNDENYIEDLKNFETYETLMKDVLTFDVGTGIDMPVTFNGIDMVMINPPLTINVPVFNIDDDRSYVEVQPLDESGDPMVEEITRYTYKTDQDGNLILDDDGKAIIDGEYTEIVLVYRKELQTETREINNIYSLLDSLFECTQKGAPPEILDQFTTPLQNAQKQTLGKTAELGGRVNRLEMLESRYEEDYINYTKMLSDADDADQSEVIMNFKMAEAVYKAALAAGSYVIQPTLMDFLR